MLSAALLLTSCTADSGDPEQTFAPVSAVGNNKLEENELYEEGSGEYTLEANTVYGIKFSSEEKFFGIEAVCKAKNDKRATATVNFYKWNGDIASTVSQNPINTGYLYAAEEKAPCCIAFYDTAFDVGEYLITLSSPKDIVFDSGSAADGVEYYKDSQPTTDIISVKAVSMN